MQTTVAISNPLPIKPISFHYSLSDPKQKHALFQRATLLKGQPFWVLVLFTWGSLLALNFALAFFKWVYVNFLRPAKTLKKYESWALVTELSGGIGKAFAFQLARKGINMILVSQNPDKLKDVSDSIQAKYSKTQIKIVVVAFAGELSKGVQRISEAIEGLDVGVVINNVGISYPYARYFHEVDEELLKNLIKMNVETMVLRGGFGL